MKKKIQTNCTKNWCKQTNQNKHNKQTKQNKTKQKYVGKRKDAA